MSVYVNIPPDIELPCGDEPNPQNTVSTDYEDECGIMFDPAAPTFYNDEVIMNGKTGCIPPIPGTFDCGN